MVSNVTIFEKSNFHMFPDPISTKKFRYSDPPPQAMTIEQIKNTIKDYVRTARWAVEECGFDGVEVHAGNGYLPEQFLASNINKRTDDYGGSPEKRGKFVLELMDELSKAIGEENLAISFGSKYTKMIRGGNPGVEPCRRRDGRWD